MFTWQYIKNLFVISIVGIIFSSISLEADYYEGSKLGYVDNIVVNDIAFDDLNKRDISFYREDMKRGLIEISGILEAEDKQSIEQLNVEISTDGGSSWNKAKGHGNWAYSFSPTVGKSYQLSLRVTKEEAKQNQKMLMRNAMADVYGQKLLEVTKQIKDIIDSDRFKKGSVAQFETSIEDIQNILINTGVNLQRGKENLGNLPGGIDLPGSQNSAGNAGVISVGDLGGYGSSSGSSILDGGFSKAALDGWNPMCTQLSYLQHSGNGDLVGRNTHMGQAAADCQKLKESWGFKNSKYMDSTATNSQTTSSPHLQDGEVLGHNGDGTTADADADAQAQADADAHAQAEADKKAAADAEAQAKAEEEAEAERKRQEEQAKKDKEEDEENQGGGDSPDPVDNEEGGKPITGKALEVAQKLLGNKNPFSTASQGGKAGGKGDGRGSENDSDTGNGMIIYTPGLEGSPDDGRVENKHNSSVVGGTVKTTVKEQLGGGIRVIEK